MRILFLAPQPFFQERGTPIAVRLALKVLAERKGDTIDLLTFAEGEDVEIENVKIHRIWSPSFLKGVRPGFSIKKIFCDLIFFFHALILLLSARNAKNKFSLVHAVEESVFMALFFKVIFKTPYIYDMDSSLALQLTEKLPFLRSIKPLLEWIETKAIRHSLAVIPVCDALAVIAQNSFASDIKVLPDISLNSDSTWHSSASSDLKDVNLREEAGIGPQTNVVLYVGNLEHYQGVELLIQSFAKISNRFDDWHLVVIGGSAKHLDANKTEVGRLGLQNQIHLIGTRSVSLLNKYLTQATILASPRILGNNTPMKIYSYMHSGVPIIATDLPTHTQVLNSETACLVAPDVQSFSEGLANLIGSSDLRLRIAQNAFLEAEKKYTFPVFRETLLGIYSKLALKLEN